MNETSEEDELAPHGGEPSGSVTLPAIFEMLAGSPDVRTELVDDIRDKVKRGQYMTDEKLNLAIYRMLKDLLS